MILHRKSCLYYTVAMKRSKVDRSYSASTAEAMSPLSSRKRGQLRAASLGIGCKYSLVRCIMKCCGHKYFLSTMRHKQWSHRFVVDPPFEDRVATNSSDI